MISRRVFLPLLLFFILMAPAGAVDWNTGPILGATQEIHDKHIKSFDLSAPEGLVLSGFVASDFSPDSNTSYQFSQYGKIYHLDVNSSKDWGWWTFDITLTHPNGTTEYMQLESLQPFATNYDIHIQYYPGNLEFDTALDVDVYAGILPLSASFDSQASSGYNYSDLLPAGMVYNAHAFSNIAGSSTSFFNLKLYACTPEDYDDMNESPIDIPDPSKVFSWVWEHILSFVEKIPGIGPQFATALIISTSLISEIFFYFNLLFVEYIETTILTIEFFIVTYSIRNTRAYSDPIRYSMLLVKHTVQNHIAVFEFIIEKSLLAVTLVMRIISAVAAAVNAIKP